MILKTPKTTKAPTPTAIPPIKRIELMVGTCLLTIMILGSATVISVPKAKENTITTKRFFCLDKEDPIYSPTFVKLEEAPMEKIANPTIKTTIPINNNK